MPNIADQIADMREVIIEIRTMGPPVALRHGGRCSAYDCDNPFDIGVWLEWQNETS